jgi:hypothetical protein
MRGPEIYKAMLARCEVLMRDDIATLSEVKELEAVAAACEAYEDVVYPMGNPARALETGQ